MSDWRAYYDAVRDAPPHSTVVRALDTFETEGVRSGFALDLGCGGGRDIAELLRRGWRVLAVDVEPNARTYLEERFADHLDRLTVRVADFADPDWPEVDLVNAGLSLPFCPPERFPATWASIERAVRPGGRFSGHLFGDRDGWASEPTMTFHSREAAEALLAGWDIEQFEEVERRGPTATGGPKLWHIHWIVARKRGA